MKSLEDALREMADIEKAMAKEYGVPVEKVREILHEGAEKALEEMMTEEEE